MPVAPAPYFYRRPRQIPGAGTLVPIDGYDLQIGDRVWTSPEHMFVVEKVRLNGPHVDPQLIATGPGWYYLGTKRQFKADAHHPFHGGTWVVVER
jgi:hypothetical protein